MIARYARFTSGVIAKRKRAVAGGSASERLGVRYNAVLLDCGNEPVVHSDSPCHLCRGEQAKACASKGFQERQEMNYIIPTIMIATGLIVGICIGVGKIEVSALLLIAPMIMFGCWIMAAAYVRRRFTVNR